MCACDGSFCRGSHEVRMRWVGKLLNRYSLYLGMRKGLFLCFGSYRA